MKRHLFCEKTRAVYMALGTITFNLLILILAVNILAFAYCRYTEGSPKVINKYLPFEFPPYLREEIYPGMSPQEVSDMLVESWTEGYVYEPYTEFRPQSRAGKYVNISEKGFRFTKDQGPWPPGPDCLNVFLFGGSTAFNIGISDSQTIASVLQDLLRAETGKKVSVYNFGRPLFFSSPERVLFERLLTEGNVPNVSVFIDGLNDFYHLEDQPGFSDRMGSLFADSSKKRTLLRDLIEDLPVMRLLTDIRNGRHSKTITEKRQIPESEWGRKDVLDGMITRYCRNQCLITSAADAFHTKALFVWQPVPMYDYFGYHPFQMGGYGEHNRSTYGYPAMRDYIAQHPMPENFLWLADMQKDLPGMLYVDTVHYNAKMSKAIAERIGQYLLEKKFL